jgi:hypothetical protein
MIEMNAELAEALGQWIAEKISEAVAPLKRELAELKAGQADLANWKYVGTWTSGFYRKNNFVISDGSLWICLDDTHTRPGENPRAWQLCTKRGRDGKDAPTVRAVTGHRPNGGSIVERRPGS